MNENGERVMDIEKIKVLLTAILDTGKLLQETSRISYDVEATDRILTSFNRASKEICNAFTELQDRLTAAESEIKTLKISLDAECQSNNQNIRERDQLRAKLSELENAAKGQEPIGHIWEIDASGREYCTFDKVMQIGDKLYAAPILQEQTTPAESVQLDNINGMTLQDVEDRATNFAKRFKSGIPKNSRCDKK